VRWPRALAWMDKGIPLSPVVRLRLSWVTLLLSVVGMLLSFVFLRGEPIFVLTLALSWLAITFTAADILSTSDVRAQQEGK
jgi:hypothetical protein